MKYTLFILSLVILVVNSCTDIIETENQERIIDLVVEGTISDTNGPYLVKLSTTTELSGNGSNLLGRRANVMIRSENGNQVSLTEIEPGGLYSTLDNNFRGEIGESYQLYIQLANGEEYESTFEEIPPPVTVFDTFAKVRTEPSGTAFDNNFFHDISIEISNNTKRLEFFSVNISGIAEVFITYGQVLTFDGSNPCVPEGIMLPQICYAIRDTLSNDVIIGNNAQVEGPSYFVDIFSIPADFELRYLAKVQTSSMSEQAYQYLNTIKTQLEKEGTIFDSPFPGLIGNVRNIRTNELAQGYFFATSITKSQVCFDRSLLNFQFSIPEICALTGPGNCVEHWNPAISDVPEGFQLCL